VISDLEASKMVVRFWLRDAGYWLRVKFTHRV